MVWLLEQNTPSGVLKQQKCTLSLLGARNRKPGCLWAVLPGGSRGALLVSFRFKGAGILGCGGILSHHVLPVRLCVSWGSRDTGLGSTPLHCDLVFSSYTCKTPLSKSGHILSFWEGRQFGGFAVSPAELARGLFNPGPGAPHPPCPPPSEAWRGVQGLGLCPGRVSSPHSPTSAAWACPMDRRKRRWLWSPWTAVTRPWLCASAASSATTAVRPRALRAAPKSKHPLGAPSVCPPSVCPPMATALKGGAWAGPHAGTQVPLSWQPQSKLGSDSLPFPPTH